MKKNKLSILILLAILGGRIKVYSQKSIPLCGTDIVMKNDIVLQRKLLEFDQEYFHDKRARIASADTTTIYTIPVVFHIYHLGEPVGTGSNVSIESIQATLASINDVFRAKGSHKGITPDTKIQFVLASRTPDCQATNGIIRIDTRTISEYESNGLSIGSSIVYSLRNLSSWPKSHYINIRVVHKINGDGGFAFYFDDMFMPSNSVNGNDGTFWAHEMGHIMNLYHTFQGDGGGQFCPENSDPENQGDQVSDTEPHKRDDDCNQSAINPCTGRFFGPVLKNIMSYSCNELFSPKQVERMRYSLINSNKGLVNSLGKYPPSAGSPASACLVQATKGPSYDCTIKKFSLGEFTYKGILPSEGSSAINYEDASCVSKTNLRAGNSYEFTLTATWTNSVYAKIYIDYNNDGDFDDNKEIAFSGNNDLSTFNGNITIPTNTIKNTLIRARVMLDPSPNIDACNLPGDYRGSGLAVDFAINILSDNCIEPPAPTTTNASRCGLGSVNLTASGCSGTYNWYTAQEGGVHLGSGKDFTTPSFDITTIYYVDCTIGECISYRSSAIAANSGPLVPIIGDIVTGSDQSVTLSVANCRGNVSWYDAVVNGNKLASGPTFITPVLTATTTYYASCEINGCVSSRGSSVIKIVQLEWSYLDGQSKSVTLQSYVIKNNQATMA